MSAAAPTNWNQEHRPVLEIEFPRNRENFGLLFFTNAFHQRTEVDSSKYQPLRHQR